MARMITVLLSALLLVQGSLLASRTLRTPQPPAIAALAEGDRLPELRVQGEGSRARVSLARRDRQWTAVLAFKSDCYWCGKVAPDWKAWLRREHPYRVIALSREPLDSALAYRDQHGWSVEVASVRGADAGAPERFLVSRTPWVFLFDGAGTLRYQGHGSTLPALDSIQKQAAGGG